MSLNTPIVFIAFNRPRHTAKTFEVIRAQKPKTLLLISDGPRKGHPSDEQNCAAVRSILENIDWPCQVHRNYSDVNLGCKNRLNSGLNWVFETVEEAIILEDDCLPNDDFFVFCEAMLEKYRYDDGIMSITGNNFQDGIKRGDATYYFSKYNHIWGWATWRRSWEQNDQALSFWPEWKNSRAWELHTPYLAERRHWTKIFDQMYRNEIDTWDHPWTCNIWHRGGLVVTPNANLVTNIGFGPEGTHTLAKTDLEGIPTQALGPLTHPKIVQQDIVADRYVFDHLLGGLNYQWHWWLLNLPKRVYRKLRHLAGY